MAPGAPRCGIWVLDEGVSSRILVHPDRIHEDPGLNSLRAQSAQEGVRFARRQHSFLPPRGSRWSRGPGENASRFEIIPILVNPIRSHDARGSRPRAAARRERAAYSRQRQKRTAWLLVARRSPQLLNSGISATSHAVSLIHTRILFIVILMVTFGGPELRRVHHLCDDGRLDLAR